MILQALMLSICLITSHCSETLKSTDKKENSKHREGMHEGPSFFRTCPLWEYGYHSFKIKPAYPQYNDYYTEFSTVHDLANAVTLDLFKKYFTNCHPILKQNESLVFPGNEASQPQIFVRPWIEQVLDQKLYAEFTITQYDFENHGGNLWRLRYGYFELSKTMANPAKNIWMKLQDEADSLLKSEWIAKIEQNKLENQALQVKFENLSKSYMLSLAVYGEETKKKESLETRYNVLIKNTIPDIEKKILSETKKLTELQDKLEKQIEAHKVQTRQATSKRSEMTKKVEQADLDLRSVTSKVSEVRGNVCQLTQTLQRLDQEKKELENTSLTLNKTIKELNARNMQVRQEIQTADGVYKELKNGVFTKENMQNVALSCLTTEYIANKWGLPPFLVNVLALAVIVVLLLILLIIWKSRKPKCTCKNKASENYDTGDEAENPKRPSSGSSAKQNGARKHFVVDMDNDDEDEEASAGHMNPNYRPSPIQSHIRPILCRAKPAMFVSED